MQPCGYIDHAVKDGQYFWCNVLYDLNKLVYMIIYVLKIKLVSFFSVL